MTKKFLIGILVLSAVFGAQAMECADGVVLRANNGVEYCKSNTQLPWKGAFAWCTAQKMKLVSWEKLCPGSVFGKNCANLRGTGENSVWTATSSAENTALRINLACGCTNNNSHTKKYYAICQ